MYSSAEIVAQLSDWPLDWISEADLTSCVQTLLDRANKTKSDKANVMDPFSALFDMAVTGMNYPEWRNSERRRQQQKTLQNAIGDFHQSVIGSIAGWDNKQVGKVVDLVNEDEKIYVELKNKFNTLKASDRDKVYNTLLSYQSKTGKYEGYTCYLVEMLTPARMDRPFAPPSNTTGLRAVAVENIREIDGVTFLAKITKSPTAFQDLYRVLPLILQKLEPTFDAQKCLEHPMFKELLEQATK